MIEIPIILDFRVLLSSINVISVRTIRYVINKVAKEEILGLSYMH